MNYSIELVLNISNEEESITLSSKWPFPFPPNKGDKVVICPQEAGDLESKISNDICFNVFGKDKESTMFLYLEPCTVSLSCFPEVVSELKKEGWVECV